MARLTHPALISLLALGWSASPASPQAIVENAALGAVSGTAAAGAKGAGAASAGVFDALKKKLDAAKQVESKTPASQVIVFASGKNSPSSVESSPEALLAVQPKDVSGITVGLTRKELIDKYGQPALKATEPGHDQLVETYTYMQGKNEPVLVTLRDGVVSAKTVAPKSQSKSASVITLQ